MAAGLRDDCLSSPHPAQAPVPVRALPSPTEAPQVLACGGLITGSPPVHSYAAASIPIRFSEAEEVSGFALTLASWVGPADSVRCSGRLNGVSGGVQVILSARRQEAGSCGPARARPWLAARAVGQCRVGTADQHQRRPGVQHPPGCPTRCTSRARGSRGCTRPARCPGCGPMITLLLHDGTCCLGMITDILAAELDEVVALKGLSVGRCGWVNSRTRWVSGRSSGGCRACPAGRTRTARRALAPRS